MAETKVRDQHADAGDGHQPPGALVVTGHAPGRVDRSREVLGEDPRAFNSAALMASSVG